MSFLGKRLGERGEALATVFLRKAGYRILAGNWKCRYGELDIVAEEAGEGTICFVEVKTRSGESHGAPVEAVDVRKRRQIARAAKMFLATKSLGDVPARFDVITIRTDVDPPAIAHFPNAFRLQDALPRRFW